MAFNQSIFYTFVDRKHSSSDWLRNKSTWEQNFYKTQFEIYFTTLNRFLNQKSVRILGKTRKNLLCVFYCIDKLYYMRNSEDLVHMCNERKA